jgi:hypothetical protein
MFNLNIRFVQNTSSFSKRKTVQQNNLAQNGSSREVSGENNRGKACIW